MTDETSALARHFDQKVSLEPKVLFTNEEILARVRRTYLAGQKKKQVLVLPHGPEVSRLMAGDKFRLKVERIYENESKQYPAVFSQVPLHSGPERDSLVEAVLLSEIPNEPMERFGGLRSFFRWTRLDYLALVREFGFYNLPGRSCFYPNVDVEIRGSLKPGSVLSVFKLKHVEVIQARTGVVALAFPSDGKFEQLAFPDEVRKKLSLFGYKQWEKHEETPASGRHLERQVLAAGEEAGVLVRVPPERFDLGGTLEINRELLVRKAISDDAFELLRSLK